MNSELGATTAGTLLDTMRVRLQLQRQGLTTPAPEVKRATELLVERLSEISPAETILITQSPGVVARYVRELDGAVIAEIPEHEG